MREIVGIFGVFFVIQRGGFGDIPERIAAQDVAIELCADTKIAVVDARDSDLV